LADSLSDGPPEALLERCAEKIQREALPQEQADLLAVAQALTPLRFPNPELLSLLGGQQAMFKSPLLQKWVAQRFHAAILDVLKDRFGTVPRDVTRHLRAVLDEKKLRQLTVPAGKCSDIQAFRDALLS
jgi:hypothetical protein